MKKLWIFIIPLFLLAEEEESLLKTYWKYHPLHVGGNGIYLGSAEVEPQHGGDSIGDLEFNKENIFATILIPVSRYTYFFPRVEWNTFRMHWDKNPKFDQTRFYYWQFALTFYTIAMEHWRWIIRADYNVDQEHFTDPLYSLFSSLFWGTYKIHRKWHYHIGALGYVGLQGNQIYPVIGADWAPNKKWFFQAVFPIVYSIDYNWREGWRISLKGRPMRERFRVGKNELQPNSIFNYSSMGAEANLHYEIPRKFEFELFAGYNFGGSFYIKNRSGHKALYTNVQGAPYAGATLDYGF